MTVPQIFCLPLFFPRPKHRFTEAAQLAWDWEARCWVGSEGLLDVACPVDYLECSGCERHVIGADGWISSLLFDSFGFY